METTNTETETETTAATEATETYTPLSLSVPTFTLGELTPGSVVRLVADGRVGYVGVAGAKTRKRGGVLFYERDGVSSLPRETVVHLLYGPLQLAAMILTGPAWAALLTERMAHLEAIAAAAAALVATMHSRTCSIQDLSRAQAAYDKAVADFRSVPNIQADLPPHLRVMLDR